MRKRLGKIQIFRLTYLICSVALAAFLLFLFGRALVLAFKNGVMLDGTVRLVALLLCALFQIAIIMFIVRSMRFGITLLMKNIVFKQDGTPFWAGVLFSAIVSVLLVGVGVTLLVSVFGNNFFGIDVAVQLLFSAVVLTLGVNLAFCFAYFVTFRHESGSFEII